MSKAVQVSRAFFELIKTICAVLVVTGIVFVGYWLYTPLQLSLPQRLKKLKSFDLVHLRSVQQEGPSCGWYAFLNAQSLEKCIKSGGDYLCQDIVRNHVSNEYLPQLKRDELKYKNVVSSDRFLNGIDFIDKYNIAKEAGLANTLQVHQVSNGDRVWLAKYYGWCPWFTNYKKLKRRTIDAVSKKNPYKHLFLGVDAQDEAGHAVLLTFIYRPNKKPLVVYMDSNNASLIKDQAYEFGFLPYSKHPGEVSKFLINLDQA